MKDMLKLLGQHVLTKGHEEVPICSGESGICNVDGKRFDFVSSDCFKNFQLGNDKRMIFNGNAKGYWNEKESNKGWWAVRLVDIYSEKTSSSMNCGTFEKYSHDLLLNFQLKASTDAYLKQKCSF